MGRRAGSEPTPRDRLDIHDTVAKVARARARLETPSPELRPPSARAILAFVEARSSAVSPQRILAYLDKLRSAAIALGPEFLEPTRDISRRFVRAFGDKATWTQLTYRSVLFSFWRWKAEREGRDLPSWLRIPISKRNVNHTDHSEILSEGEVASLAEHAGNLRDKALIWVLFESGARVGEVLTLRLGDVERNDGGWLRLYFPTGKTGRRTVPVFGAAVPNLLLWLKNHPRRDDPSAPLWCGIQQGSRIGEPIGYRMAVKVLRSAAKRAGIAKPVNPHNFRHSRASNLAQNPKISTSILEKAMGWTPGSPMAKTYVHLSGKEVEDALARASGREVGERAAPRPRLPIVCARCSTTNEPDGRFCTSCGGPLSIEAVEQAERRRPAERLLAKVLRDPEIRSLLLKRLAEASE